MTKRIHARPLQPSIAALVVGTLLATPLAAQPAPDTEPVPGDAAATETSPTDDESPATDTAEIAELRARLDAQQAQVDAQRADLDDAKVLNEQQQALLSDQQKRLEGLLETQTAEEDAVAVDEPRLRFYGFMEVGGRAWWTKTADDSGSAPPGFLLGNVNLYVDAQPAKTVRALTEVRLTPYPHRTLAPGSGFNTTDTTVYDESSATAGNRVQWGGVVLERAQLEWNPRNEFRLTAGYFLTPYGIWNVDHGSPTLISSAMPLFFALEFFPTRQLGVQAAGLVFAGQWELGYHAYLSNGRSQAAVDYSKGKLVGGRVFATLDGPARVTLGASGAHENDAEAELEISGFLPVTADETNRVQYLSGAVDLSVDYQALRLRAEYVNRRTTYEDGERPEFGPGVYYADRFQWVTYGLAAYRLPRTIVEPYLYFEAGNVATGPTYYQPSAGVNLYLRSAVRLKSQYLFIHSPRSSDFDERSAHIVDVRAVVTY